MRDRDLAERFVRIGGFRNRLVHHHEEVTPDELYEIVARHLDDLEALAAELQAAVERMTAS